MAWYSEVTGGYEPTDEEMELSRYFVTECERLGINIFSFNEKESLYTKDELKAMSILCKGKKLPPKLENRLLDTRDERVTKPLLSEGVTLSLTPEDEEEFERLFGNSNWE